MLDPVTTVHLFLLRILRRNTARAHLTAAGREVAIEILRETKKDLPTYWKD